MTTLLILDTNLIMIMYDVKKVMAKEHRKTAREMFRDCYALFIISPFLSEGVIADLLDDYNSNADAGPTLRLMDESAK